MSCCSEGTQTVHCVVFTFLKELIILLLVFHDELVAQWIYINLFFVECKMICYVVGSFVFEPAETVGNNAIDPRQID